MSVCGSVAVGPNARTITPKRSDSAACEPLLFRARGLRRGRAHHQQPPRGLGARPARASPRPDSIPARSSELTWPPVRSRFLSLQRTGRKTNRVAERPAPAQATKRAADVTVPATETAHL